MVSGSSDLRTAISMSLVLCVWRAGGCCGVSVADADMLTGDYTDMRFLLLTDSNNFIMGELRPVDYLLDAAARFLRYARCASAYNCSTT